MINGSDHNWAKDILSKVRAGEIARSMPPARSDNPLIKAAWEMMRVGCLQKARGRPASAFGTAVKAMRTLDKIRIDRISAVDRPAQEGALVRIIKHANPMESDMNNSDLDTLSKRADELIGMIDKALGKRVTRTTHTVEHDDGTYDDVSNPSNGATNDNSTVDDDWSPASEDDQDEEDGVDDVQARAAKASNTDFENTRSSNDRPGALTSSTHPSSNNSRHKFEALVDKIKNEEGLPPSEATRQVRLRFADVWRSYQQHTKPGGYSKRAPTSYEELVAAEMAKGCNLEVAGQRVMQLYGSSAPRSMFAKGEDANDRFQKRVDEIAYRDGCDLVTATRRARHEHPGLVRAMNV